MKLLKAAQKPEMADAMIRNLNEKLKQRDQVIASLNHDIKHYKTVLMNDYDTIEQELDKIKKSFSVTKGHLTRQKNENNNLKTRNKLLEDGRRSYLEEITYYKRALWVIFCVAVFALGFLLERHFHLIF